MRRDDGVLHPSQRVVERQRLGIEHIERRADDPLGLQRLDERRLVDNQPARGVDEERGRLHQRELARADQPGRSWRQDEVDRDDVGATEKIVLGREGDAGGRAGLGCQILAPGEDLHAECPADGSDLASQPAEADHAERLAANASPDGPLPGAEADVAILLRDVAHEAEDQAPGELGRRIAERFRAGDDDATLGAGREVDGRVAKPARHQELQRRQLVEERARERCPLAHDDDDLERAEPGRDRVLVVQMIAEHGDRDIARDRPPVREPGADVLVVVDDRAALHAGPSASFGSSWRPRPGAVTGSPLRVRGLMIRARFPCRSDACRSDPCRLET